MSFEELKLMFNNRIKLYAKYDLNDPATDSTPAAPLRDDAEPVDNAALAEQATESFRSELVAIKTPLNDSVLNAILNLIVVLQLALDFSHGKSFNYCLYPAAIIGNADIVEALALVIDALSEANDLEPLTTESLHTDSDDLSEFKQSLMLEQKVRQLQTVFSDLDKFVFWPKITETFLAKPIGGTTEYYLVSRMTKICGILNMLMFEYLGASRAKKWSGMVDHACDEV